VLIILKSYVQLRNSHATPVFCPVLLLLAQAIPQLVEALRYKPEDGGFEYRNRPHSASDRNEYPEYFLRVRAAGKYLGSKCTKDGRHTKNIRHRVTQARKIINALNGIWWSKDITKNRKKMIYNSMVKSVLIYGAETWSYEDDRRRINATEKDALRRSARISKLH